MSRALYNENDPAAADWLEWLIAERLVPDGRVDRRSIADIEPGDLDGYDHIHFFAGIGGWGLASRLARWPADRRLWTGSCPCQPFSSAGRRMGADDPRHLWPHFFRLIRACRPPVVVGEQVAGALGYGWLDGVAADLGGAGYACRAVDVPAAAVDSPQIRQRLWWIAVDRLGVGLADADGARGHLRPGSARRAAAPSQGAPQGQDGQRPGLHDHRTDAASALAGGPGEHGGQLLEERRPEGRTAAAGDDAGERPGFGVALGDPESIGRGEGLDQPAVLWRRGAAASADGTDPHLGAAQGCTESGSRAGAGQPEAPGRPPRRGEHRRPDDGDGDDFGAAQGRAESRRLEIGQFTGWGEGSPARWLDAAGADDRNGSWWSGADWILCHDGKARRIAQCLPSVLVDGLSVDLARILSALTEAAREAVIDYATPDRDPAKTLRMVRDEYDPQALFQRCAGVCGELPTPEVLFDFLQHVAAACSAGPERRGIQEAYGFADDGLVRGLRVVESLVRPSCRWRPDERASLEPADALRQLSLFLACCAQACWAAAGSANAAPVPLLARGAPGRVTAWKGIGNAISPPLAAEVLAALLESGDLAA